jgi:5-methylcytosine-specific restriction endonuclease McrA
VPTSKEWNQSATNWPELIERYTAYLATPRWRGKVLTSAGADAQDCITSTQAARLQASLLALVAPLIDSGVVARTVVAPEIRRIATSLNYSGRRFDECPKRLWHLWRAVIFNRDGYTCRYCGRSTWEVEAAQGRGLRFELDHATPRARLSMDCDDFDEENIVTACRSCNVLKGQMDSSRFEVELRSLAQAVKRKYPSSEAV